MDLYDKTESILNYHEITSNAFNRQDSSAQL